MKARLGTASGEPVRDTFHGRADPDFDGEYYTQWRNGRMSYLYRVLGKPFFSGKTVLELASGYGHIGRELSSCGAKVTCVDGRQEYIDEIRKRGGVANALVVDLDKDFSFLGQFDVIVNFGILYHLTNPFAHLDCCARILNNGALMLLESVVADSLDPDYRYVMQEVGYDQSLSGRAVYLPPSAIERHLDSLHLYHIDISSPRINEHYTWILTGAGGITRDSGLYNRKMWLVSKDRAFADSKKGFRARPWQWPWYRLGDRIKRKLTS